MQSIRCASHVANISATERSVRPCDDVHPSMASTSIQAVDFPFVCLWVPAERPRNVRWLTGQENALTALIRNRAHWRVCPRQFNRPQSWPTGESRPRSPVRLRGGRDELVLTDTQRVTFRAAKIVRARTIRSRRARAVGRSATSERGTVLSLRETNQCGPQSRPTVLV
jgi:hypothetical protein